MILMSTRGVVGFRKDRKDKIVYNGSDSYPSYCGANVIRIIQEHSNEEFSRLFDRIMTVGYDTTLDDSILTPDFEGIIDHIDDDYTCIIIDYHDFLQDSLFCEWGYIINLDENCLEIWRGFQTKPQQNRYKLTRQQAIKLHGKAHGTDEWANIHKDGKKTYSYYNCAIIARWNLDAIRESEIDMNSFEMGFRAGEQNGSKSVPEINKYLSFRGKQSKLPSGDVTPAIEQKDSWLYVEE